MQEYKEIYDCIIREFQLNVSTLEQVKESVETLAKARIEICKLFKISKFMDEALNLTEKELIRNININVSNIKDYEKKQIELNDKIKIYKQEIKLIKIHINKLEIKLMEEQKESRKLSEALHIFLSREKFKFIKKIILKKYRKVFLRYVNELNIKTEIVKCNKRKGEIRQEKQNFNNSIERYNRKIIIAKIALAEIRKGIINMQKSIDFSTIKLRSLEEYIEREKKFGLEVRQCQQA